MGFDDWAAGDLLVKPDDLELVKVGLWKLKSEITGFAVQHVDCAEDELALTPIYFADGGRTRQGCVLETTRSAAVNSGYVGMRRG